MSATNPRFLSKIITYAGIVAGPTSVIVASCIWASGPSNEFRSVVVPIPPGMSEGKHSTAPSTPMIMPAFQQPSLVAANEAQLHDEAPVIGVTIGDTNRAYSLDGMSAPSTHVLNDFFNSTAVTVAYCDRTDCARVFADEQLETPLTMRVAGWVNGQMGVQFENRFYVLNSPEIPLEEFDFVRMSWGEWKKRYPNSEVFIGGVDAKFGAIHFNQSS